MKTGSKEKKKFLKIFATLEFSSQNGWCVRRMSSIRYKIQIYKINTKLTMGSWNFDVIKGLKRNFSGYHEVLPILDSKEDDGSNKKKSGICSQKVIRNREHVSFEESEITIHIVEMNE